MARTVLTRDDRKFLDKIGHSISDIAEIGKFLGKTRYELITPDGETLTISENEAITRLGREEWLRGIGKSTFFVETTRWGLNGERVRIRTESYKN